MWQGGAAAPPRISLLGSACQLHCHGGPGKTGSWTCREMRERAAEPKGPLGKSLS